jgi:N-acetylglutamate synthase-like GNAT family acetyltransferase
MSLSLPMSVEITTFRNDLRQGVRDLILPIQRDEFGIDITYEQQPDLQDVDGFYRKGCGEFWVAVAGGEVVGSIALVDIGNAQAALRKMFVRADQRGAQRGVAQRLLERLLEHAAGCGVREVFLGTTSRFLAAHRFYEKAGFLLIDESDLPQRFPRMAVDTRFYLRRLAEGGVSSD